MHKDSSQLTAHSSQLTAHSSQLTAHSSQLTAHSSQLTAHSDITPAELAGSELVVSLAAANKKEVPVVFCADKNYGFYLPVVVQSIIDNSSASYYYQIIVLDCGAAKEAIDALQRQIRLVANFSLHVKNIEDWLDQHRQVFEEKWHLTRAMYGRLLIPELCRGYDKVIYSDIDVVFNRDIADLMSIDLEENYIAGVIDVATMVGTFFDKKINNSMRGVYDIRAGEYYINSGILVFNTKAWLALNLSGKAIDLLSERKFLFPDQDAINSICNGKIVFLEQEWNSLPPKHFSQWEKRFGEIHLAHIAAPFKEWKKSYNSNRGVFHFTGRGKPWEDVSAKNGSLWWYYAGKTPIYSYYIRNLALSAANSAFTAAKI